MVSLFTGVVDFVESLACKDLAVGDLVVSRFLHDQIIPIFEQTFVAGFDPICTDALNGHIILRFYFILFIYIYFYYLYY